MKRQIFLFLLLLLTIPRDASHGAPLEAVVCGADASPLEKLAAKEVRRYVYVRTGALLRIAADMDGIAGDVVVIGQKDGNHVRATADAAGMTETIQGLAAQEYCLRTVKLGGRRALLIAGGDDIGTLYGAYRLAERLGVRFYLHGDVVPDARIEPILPDLDETGRPLFALRGIQPFHDFPEGPDWWNLDDYKAILDQLPKMRMNFIGLHCYPHPEPLIWIGPPEDMTADGKPTHSYPARHFTTANGRWGYDAMKTGDYVFGAGQMFDRDDYGADYMRGLTPMPDTPEKCDELFVRMGSLLRDAFTFARRLGIKTCIGTETPLHVPKEVKERLLTEKPERRSWQPMGGKHARYQNPIAATEDDTIYQSVRWSLDGYRFSVPNGTYTVTLRFSEVAYDKKGRRVFGVTIQGENVIDRLDIFDKVGKNTALDFTFTDVSVTNGVVEIGFVRQVEHPCIAAIAVEGKDYTAKVNCAGGPYKDYAADEGVQVVSQQDVQRLYEGIFLRIQKTHPLDYYWLWTPEGWTWRGATQKQVDDTVADLKSAMAALGQAKAPFTLGTCGWVLGPPQDRALFDNLLPKVCPMSCINRKVGNTPVEEGFSRIDARPKWAIPWLEDDPGMIIPQLWAGRMRRDAADAHAYGCTGLMGIHWRTRILGPNVAALAAAAWDQKGWNPNLGRRLRIEEPKLPEGPEGGKAAMFPKCDFADTDLDELYRTVRYGMKSYRLKVPNGTYAVTLHLAEPHYQEKGKRAFGAQIEGRDVFTRMDVFATAGRNRAADRALQDVKVKDEELLVRFVPHTGAPCIAGISVSGATEPSNQFPARPFSRRVNCGGPKWRDYEADLPPVEPKKEDPRPRGLPVDDFYLDWASSQFGPEAAKEIAGIFVDLDGKLPRPATWVRGPGGIVPDQRPWEDVEKEYTFAERLAALRPRIQGAGSLERFDYWLSQFRYIRAMAEHNCMWSRFEAALKETREARDPAAKQRIAEETALPLWRRMVELLADVHRHLFASITTPGGMGNVTNWQQHIIARRRGNSPRMQKVATLADSRDELAERLGGQLPQDALWPRDYPGPARLLVPTVRGSIEAGEDFCLTVIILGFTPEDAALLWRPLGSGDFAKAPLQHINRGAYKAHLPAGSAKVDFEYYVQARSATGRKFRFPPTAPGLNQTVIVMEGR